MEADVIVVGAGPAGASTAYHLAKNGHQVLLLDRARFPRDKSCGDGLTRFSARQLADMGVLDLLPEAGSVHGVRVHMRGHSHRDFRYPENLDPRHQGLVVPRVILDHAICQRAQAAGAVLWEETIASDLIRDDEGVVRGVVVRRSGEEVSLHARVVVAADGAMSRLARQAGLTTTSAGNTGYAIRGYYDNIDGLSDLLEIYMPLLDPTDRYLLPSYGWVFPTGPASANIGVGLVRRERDANVRELFERFLTDLYKDPRFRSAMPRGKWLGAPLRFDFQPERCSAPGLLLVGDAAGMISPFTGEGIGYALTSGRLAADAIHAALTSPSASVLDLSAYPRSLTRRFTGYFEAGRESAHRYKLIWHVLENTFQNEKPLFDICRRAALFPEGIGESYIHEVFEDISPALRGPATSPEDKQPARAELATLHADLLAVGELLLGSVRANWPFLASVLTAEETIAGIPFRPATLLLLAGRIDVPRRNLMVPVAAAIEMGFVAALAHASVGDDEGPSVDNPHKVSPVNWGNRFALMVGDFLLSNAYALSSKVAAEASGEIAMAISKASEGHLRGLRHAYSPDLTPKEYLEIVDMKAGTLFELPCQLGAQLCGAAPRIVSALGSYGRHLGVAYQLVHDLSDARNHASEMGHAIGSDPAAGIYPYSTIYALQTELREPLRRALTMEREGQGVPNQVADLVREAGGVQAAFAESRRAITAAKRSLQSVPEGVIRTWLDRISDFVCK